MWFGRKRVHYHDYDRPLDLTGKDLIGLLSHPKKDIAVLVGSLVLKEDMERVRVPSKTIFSMTGEVADEVHELPNARLGTTFYHLVLQFRDDRLIGFNWRFRGPPA